RIGLGDDFLPIFTFGIGGVHYSHAGTRCVFVGGDVKLVLVDLAAVQEVFAAGDLNRRGAGFQILQVHFAFSPTLEYGDEQPAIIVVSELHTGYVLGFAAFAEDQWILRGVGSHDVIENFDVIDLFPGRHIPLFRMSAVKKGGVIFFPGDAGEAGTLDGVRQLFPACGFDHFQCAFFRAAGGSAISDILAVFRGKPPVEGDRAVGGELVHV